MHISCDPTSARWICFESEKIDLTKIHVAVQCEQSVLQKMKEQTGQKFRRRFSSSY